MNKDPSPEKMTDDEISFLANACWLIPRTALVATIILAIDTWKRGVNLHTITIGIFFFLLLFCLGLWKTGNKFYKLYGNRKKSNEDRKYF